MKTATLTLKRNILVIEMPENTTYKNILGYIGALQNDSIDYHLTIHNASEWSLLGSPEEIKEEDVRDLVEKVMNGQHFQNYNSNEIWDRWCKTALESFNSALEKEIYWNVNPIEKPPKNDLNGSFFTMQKNYHKENEYEEAESRTFDRKRTLIFIEN